MFDEKNKKLAQEIATAWDKYLTSLKEEKRKEIFGNYKKYWEEYAKFASTYRLTN